MTTYPQPGTPFAAALAAVQAGASPTDQAALLYAQLTDQEKLDLLDGDWEFWPGMREMFIDGYNLRPIPMGHVERLGIPGVQFADGPRGIVVGHSTAFPVSMARGATWDTALEEAVGLAIGREGRAQGATFFGGVCINLPRHPSWGRAQETYSEDPYLLGEFGAALTRGIQHNLMACVKHYALNSMENARFTVDVTCAPEVLHEFFLAHFRRVIEEGAYCVMSSYNSVNGTWAGQNEELLTNILRGDWGFEGFVVTDFIWGMRDGSKALRAGLDVEAPFRQQRGRDLPGDLASGQAQWADVERAGLRIIATQLRYFATRDAAEPPIDVVASPEHRALARLAAARSMVLLRNEPVGGSPVLPINPANLKSLAVLGRLADLPNTGDHGSSDVRAPQVVTALAGLQAALPGTAVHHITADDPATAAAQAAAADVALVVVGYTADDEGEYVGGEVYSRPELTALYPPALTPEAKQLERQLGAATTEEGRSVVGAVGEGGDRASIRLLPADVALIKAVAAANPRTVVAIVAAGAVITAEWDTEVPAVLVAWYAGMEGGNALADVLLGAVDAAGRLPFSVPQDEADLPAFDRNAAAITYDRWFGQRLLDHKGVKAAYPLGWGLSYTTWALSGATAARSDDRAAVVGVTVANTGSRDGRHVVQVYARAADGERFLVGFAPVEVAAGGAATAQVPVSLVPLGKWDAIGRRLRLPRGPVALEVGAYAGDPAAQIVILPD
ncbi:MAG: glycoside hydrolase family 3 C-terminal domain-containing protein [Bifidobacteriaceae bacterium]|jgi:beta-glucosidase-like glycosyl hydrolase|nr:glycoside hydrolase family 3 C-terminal domain-containing protein [Bifidobacteriaceae bacterium]